MVEELVMQGGTDETPQEKMFREMKNAKVQAAIKLAGEKKYRYWKSNGYYKQ
jgi:hypothetical protein